MLLHEIQAVFIPERAATPLYGSEALIISEDSLPETRYNGSQHA